MTYRRLRHLKPDGNFLHVRATTFLEKKDNEYACRIGKHARKQSDTLRFPFCCTRKHHTSLPAKKPWCRFAVLFPCAFPRDRPTSPAPPSTAPWSSRVKLSPETEATPFPPTPAKRSPAFF